MLTLAFLLYIIFAFQPLQENKKKENLNKKDNKLINKTLSVDDMFLK